ncbi:type II toxin-antitoxin system VapC family toxin [Neorhizobium lilium]|uniref:Type II toxin-antitoxin system VapC family toxin n=1 Tax=Neorhizobium lilium TaxID=2503024 RepID=A0A444LEU8_9HYPH|nr:type II toxin-antitoxin system VapC family toxin [Neorhizobium lilium]RWX76722.1 type II toxin-antitoxin system VapC family toxin [Neorhizobium lilium]
MIAIDTNLIIRYLTGDDTQQSRRARELINGETVFVPITVTLEVEWVLRSIYRMGRVDCVEAIRGFSGLPTVVVDEAAIVAEALDLFAQGMDFADALHLLKARHCEKFVTFDRKFIKAAQAAGHHSVQDA